MKSTTTTYNPIRNVLHSNELAVPLACSAIPTNRFWKFLNCASLYWHWDKCVSVNLPPMILSWSPSESDAPGCIFISVREGRQNDGIMSCRNDVNIFKRTVESQCAFGSAKWIGTNAVICSDIGRRKWADCKSHNSFVASSLFCDAVLRSVKSEKKNQSWIERFLSKQRIDLCGKFTHQAAFLVSVVQSRRYACCRWNLVAIGHLWANTRQVRVMLQLDNSIAHQILVERRAIDSEHVPTAQLWIEIKYSPCGSLLLGCFIIFNNFTHNER